MNAPEEDKGLVELSEAQLTDAERELSDSLRRGLPLEDVSHGEVRALVASASHRAARRRSRRRAQVPALVLASAAVATGALMGVATLVSSANAPVGRPPASGASGPSQDLPTRQYLTQSEVSSVIPALGADQGAPQVQSIDQDGVAPLDACGRTTLPSAVIPQASLRQQWSGPNQVDLATSHGASPSTGTAVLLSVTVSAYSSAPQAADYAHALQVNAATCTPLEGAQEPQALDTVLLQQFAGAPPVLVDGNGVPSGARASVDAGAVFTTGYDIERGHVMMTAVAVSGKYSAMTQGVIPTAQNSDDFNAAATKLCHLAILAATRAAVS